jgi:hypothetical protein
MRSKEFLPEGALKAADFKNRNRLANFITKLETKDPFYTINGDQIVVPASAAEIKFLKNELKNKFDPSLEKGLALEKVEIPQVIGGIRLSSLQKTAEFGGVFSVSKTGEIDVSKANLGPTVEALKAFGIYARLVFRGKAQIDAQDVMQIGKIAAKYAKEQTIGKSKTPTTAVFYSRNVPDSNGQVTDKITLEIALSTPAFKRAVQTTPADKEAWGNLQGIIKYVNEESDIAKYSRFFSGNNKRDPLKIAVVGIGGDKVDIKSTYQTASGEEKLIQNLNLSVKAAGAEWYDQASANNIDGMYKFFEIMGLSDDAANNAIVTADFQEGGKNSTPQEFAERLQSVALIYEVAYNQLKERMAKLNDKGEADYVQGFLSRLKNSLAGDQRLVYVKFDVKGTYKKLKPHLLMNLARVMDLDVNFSSDPGRPTIYWIDRQSGRTLIYVVLLKVPSEKRLTHQFNLGKDFFPLLDAAEAAMQGKPSS